VHVLCVTGAESSFVQNTAACTVRGPIYITRWLTQPAHECSDASNAHRHTAALSTVYTVGVLWSVTKRYVIAPFNGSLGAKI